MTRLKRIVAAAAALVVSGGIALAVALTQANQADPMSLTCAEWDDLASRPQRGTVFFVATTQGYTPPEAVGEYVLGTCANGECSIKPSACSEAITYTYERGTAVNGWRLYRIDAPLYFAAAYKALAASTADVRFYRGYRDLKADCLSHLSAADCRDLITSVAPCWKRPDGQYCRYGLLYGPGQGGSQACVVGANDTPYPCGSTRGPWFFDEATQQDFPPDSELVLQ